MAETITESKFNSEEYGFKDMKLVLGGRPVTGFRKIMFKINRVQEELHASGSDPWSIQSGNKSYTGEMTFLQSEIEALNEAAQALGKDDITDLNLSAIVNFSVTPTDPMKTHEILGLKFEEFGMGGDQGATSMPVDLIFKARKIKLNV